MALKQEELLAHFERTAQTYDESFPAATDFALDSIKACPPITSSSVVHDNACGTGAISGAIFASGARPARVVGTDLSEPMIRMLRKKAWSDGVETHVQDSAKLTLPDDTFTYSFTNFVLMALPDGDAVGTAKHLYRTLKPGGAAEVSTWAELAYMAPFQKAADEANPGAKLPAGGVVIPEEWLGEDKLRDTLVAGGFERSKIEIARVRHMLDPALLKSPAMEHGVRMMVQNMVSRDWTDAQKAAFGPAVDASFDEAISSGEKLPMAAWIAVARK